jgi:signal transduction histidine kinase
LRLEVEPGLPHAWTDEGKVRQIVANLVENAIKYAPEGPIQVTVDRLDDRVAVSVRDHGPGIPVADRERVFERFVQLDQSSTRRAGGTGLGLYLCRRMAETIGAELTLAAGDGGGAVFTLSLPLAPLGSTIQGGAPDLVTGGVS